MNVYNKMIDPELKTLTIIYSDTDSMHMTAENHKKINEMGVIKNELGYLANDIKK